MVLKLRSEKREQPESGQGLGWKGWKHFGSGGTGLMMSPPSSAHFLDPVAKLGG